MQTMISVSRQANAGMIVLLMIVVIGTLQPPLTIMVVGAIGLTALARLPPKIRMRTILTSSPSEAAKAAYREENKGSVPLIELPMPIRIKAAAAPITAMVIVPPHALAPAPAIIFSPPT